MTSHIVVLDPILEERAVRMRAMLPQGFRLSHATARDDEHLKQIIADADYAISGQRAVTADILRAAKKLKLLHKWGVGVDNFDLDAAREQGIKVARTTGSNALPVAESTVGLMLSLLRNIVPGHVLLQQGDWMGVRRGGEGVLLTRRTVGLVGFGYIGKAVARMLRGFECRILYNKPTRLGAQEEAELGVTYVELSQLLAESDVVSLHCPLTPQTRDLIDYAALSSMKRSAILINMARGGIVVENDLIRALQDKIIRCAATDVYAQEPLPPDSPLLNLPNLVTTPHIAALANDTFEKSLRQIYNNVLRVEAGEPVDPADSVVG
jgi:phosphoglycerate dehydrogenase-like enzyme